MELAYQGAFNPELLFEELVAAKVAPAEAIYLESKPDDSAVYITLPDTADARQVEALVAAHDPTKLSPNQKSNLVAGEAKADAKAIPLWAEWTDEQALAFIEGTVTDVDSVKLVLRDMTRLLIALRNQAWPDLQK